jgi:HD-GYP domain-containing protein (c-di-GMP phosphodiesterase class II)
MHWDAIEQLMGLLSSRYPGPTTWPTRHAVAVAQLASEVASRLGMGEKQCALAYSAGLVHDIGHLAFSDSALGRGPLTDADWETIQRHPEVGSDLLLSLGLPGLAEIVVAHHERFDGRGYPHGLAGGRIPHIARVIHVAEVYDTITGDETYRIPPMNKRDAIHEIQRVTGSQIDRQCVEALVDVLHSSTSSWNATQTSHAHDGRAFAAAVKRAKQSDAGRRRGDG